MTRVTTFLLAALLLLMSMSALATDTRFLQGLGDSRYLRVESETIGRDFHIYVMLDAIIVGISYGSDSYEGGNYRSTDYTAKTAEREYWGGSGDFQRFLRDELIPFVEHTYRSRSDRRIIFGQSIGGQFVLYTALHRNLPFFLEAHGAASSSGTPCRLFVASGSDDSGSVSTRHALAVFFAIALHLRQRAGIYFPRRRGVWWNRPTVLIDPHVA